MVEPLRLKLREFTVKLMGFVNLLLYVHGKQLRTCWNGQLLNHKLVGV